MTGRRLPRVWLYVLVSLGTKEVYLGYTTNLKRRLRQHNSPRNRGYTRRGAPWRLLAVRCFLDKHSAKRAERQLKRRWWDKINWIRRVRPRMRKLSARQQSMIKGQ